MISFTARGIQFHCSSGFLFLLSWLNFMDKERILPFALLACFLHELGHILVIYVFHGRISAISLTMIGASIELEGDFSQFSYVEEFFCAISGATVNLLFAFLCSALPNFELFVGLNLALALFNLIPMSKLDGGRGLYCLLALFFPLSFCQSFSLCMDIFCSYGLLALGFWILLEGGTITLFLLGIWSIQSVLSKKIHLHRP